MPFLSLLNMCRHTDWNFIFSYGCTLQFDTNIYTFINEDDIWICGTYFFFLRMTWLCSYHERCWIIRTWMNDHYKSCRRGLFAGKSRSRLWIELLTTTVIDFRVRAVPRWVLFNGNTVKCLFRYASDTWNCYQYHLYLEFATSVARQL